MTSACRVATPRSSSPSAELRLRATEEREGRATHQAVYCRMGLMVKDFSVLRVVYRTRVGRNTVRARWRRSTRFYPGAFCTVRRQWPYEWGVVPIIGKAPTCRSSSISSMSTQKDETFPSPKPKSATA
jgi:hypothetical protein